MSPQIAMFILTWAAIILLFLGLGANMREIRLLRISLDRADGYTSALPDLKLGNRFASRIVLAADSGCPLCLAVAERLIEHGTQATLLTFEDVQRWPAGIQAGLDVVSDPEVWRAIAHLSPPALMRVGADGTVSQVVLPVSVSEADRVIGEWMNTSTNQGVMHDTHA